MDVPLYKVGIGGSSPSNPKFVAPYAQLSAMELLLAFATCNPSKAHEIAVRSFLLQSCCEISNIVVKFGDEIVPVATCKSLKQQREHIGQQGEAQLYPAELPFITFRSRV